MIQRQGLFGPQRRFRPAVCKAHTGMARRQDGAQNPAGAKATFPTVSGRIYHGYFSTKLTNWFQDNTRGAITGDGSPAQRHSGLSPPHALERRFQ